MLKNMRIDFYRVRFRDEPLFGFGGALTSIEKSVPLGSRNRPIMGDTFRLQSLESDENTAVGDMLRIRMDNLPVKASLAGEIDELGLDEDEGIGEESAFLFDAQLAVLLYQRNRTGVPLSRFASYVESMLGLQDPVYFDPILEPDAITKLRLMRRHTRLEVNCARADNPAIWPGDDAVTTSIRNLSALNAPSVRISVSCGHYRRRSVAAVALRDTLAALRPLIHREDQQLKKVEISGRSADDEALVVDLVEDRMVETPIVDVGRHRHAAFEIRAGLLRKAHAARVNDLRKVFSTDESRSN